MSKENVYNYLKRYGLESRLMVFDSSSHTVALAAEKIGCKEEQIVKSLSFIVNDMPVIICVKGDGRIDNTKFKEQFHTKAKMIQYEDVEKLTGHIAGGVCPFAVNDDVKIYFDESIKKIDGKIYPAGGSDNTAVELELNELEEIVKIEGWVDVTKGE